MCSSLGGRGKCASNLPPHLKQVYADRAISTNLNLALISLGVFDQRHCILITPSWLFQPWLQSLVREDIKETLYHTHPYHSCDFEIVHTCCSQFILAFSSSTLRLVLKITFCGRMSQKWLASYVRNMKNCVSLSNKSYDLKFIHQTWAVILVYSRVYVYYITGTINIDWKTHR